jgi:subtilisin-like proprotein convertase family protein
LFGAVQGVALSAASSPNSREWDGRDSGLVISDISAPGDVISFKFGEAQPGALVASGQASPMATIPDNKTAGISSTITIAQSGTVAAIKVTVDIQHSYIGDLRVALLSPSGQSTVLHPRLGGSADNLVVTYDSATPGILGIMIGQPMMGSWTLNVSDRASLDVGKLRSWSIELKPAPSGPGPVSVASKAVRKSRRPKHK